MTDAIQAFPLTLPGSGNPNQIFFVPALLGDSNVTQIILTFPAGCAGNVNVRVESGGAQLYPLKPGTWFNFDDYVLVIPVSNQVTTGQWHVAGYNTDFYAHTVTAYFYYDYLAHGASSPASSLVSL